MCKNETFLQPCSKLFSEIYNSSINNLKINTLTEQAKHTMFPPNSRKTWLNNSQIQKLLKVLSKSTIFCSVINVNDEKPKHMQPSLKVVIVHCFHVESSSDAINVNLLTNPSNHQHSKMPDFSRYSSFVAFSNLVLSAQYKITTMHMYILY